MEKFRGECENFNLRLSPDIKIRGSDAVTQRRMAVGADPSQSPDPSEVLSEGEQTIAALADFLAELSINKQKIGIIFDDPVNSMDHLHKDKIAERLVKEALARQVIIFTHDIIFVNSLAKEAEKFAGKGIGFKGCTISIDPSDKTPGYVDHSIFPCDHHEKTADIKAENYLNEAKGLTGTEQMEKLKIGIGALRTGYENFIQKHIFGDVVTRWRENIRATALTKLYWDKNTNKDVANRYDALSRWIEGHSHSLEYQGKSLDCNELEQEIKSYRNIVNLYKRDRQGYIDKLSNDKKKIFS